MSELTRGRDGQNLSREAKFLRRERGQKRKIVSPCCAPFDSEPQVEFATMERLETPILPKIIIKAAQIHSFMCVVCVLSSHSFWTAGLWTYQPGSHERKFTQDFSSTFLLRCLP